MAEMLSHIEETAKAMLKQFQHEQAEQYLEDSIESLQGKVPAPHICTLLLLYYETCNRQSNMLKASKIAKQLETLLHSNGDELSSLTKGKIHLAMAQQLIPQKKFLEAEINVNLAIDIFNKEQSVNNLAITYFSKAAIYKMNGQYELSEQEYERALSILNEEQHATIIGNAYVFIGMLKFVLSEFDQSFALYHKAIDCYEKDNNKPGLAAVLSNIGNLYRRLADNQKAIEYYERALELNRLLNRKTGIATVQTNLGNVFLTLKDYDRALFYYESAITLYEELGNRDHFYSLMVNIGNLYLETKQYDQALIFYNKAYSDYRNPGNYVDESTFCLNMSVLYSRINQFDKAMEYALKGLELSKKNDDEYRYNQFMSHTAIIRSQMKQDHDSLRESINDLTISLEHAQTNGLKGEQLLCLEYLSLISADLEDWKIAFEYQRQFHALSAEINTLEVLKQAELTEFNRKVMQEEYQRKQELIILREQSRILQDVLPSTIAERIIAGEKTIAEETQSVSIFFSDIVGFTQIAESIKPAELVHSLNELFTAFDNLAKKHGIEKIKTIGDSYMAVCGIPEQKEDHALRISRFALEIIDLSKEFDFNGKKIELRIGLHAGSVVAGVIGLNRYTYDLWGDAVNVASRLESTGLPGRIQVSDTFLEKLTSQSVNDVKFEYRGETEMKGKGKMKTYFLN